MNCHHVRAWKGARKPVEVRDMNDVTMQPAYDGAEFKVALGRGFRLEQRNCVKIGGERPDLPYFFRGSYQEILILPVKPAKGSNYISGVGSYAEIRHAPDINPDLHDVI